MPAKNNPADTSEPVLVIKRIFDAPRSLVFNAWTRPEHLERWQGAPHGFTMTSHTVDFRPGGAFRVCMRSPEGVDHWLQGIYREIDEPGRLVFTHAWLDSQGKPGQETLVTVTFADHDGKTELTLRQTGFKSVQARDGHQIGWNSMLDRLAEYVLIAGREWVITRVFDAPRSLVFKAWTDPKQMARWWGLCDFTCPVCEMDVRPGGAYRIVMRSPDGEQYPMKGVYREVVKDERLVYTSDLSEHPEAWHDLVSPGRDKSKGKPALNPVTTVIFEERDGKTALTVRMLFETVAMRDSFVKLGMSEGWSQSFEKLEKILSTI